MSTIITPVCRLCLEVIAKGKTFYNIDEQNGLPKEVQNVQNIRDIIQFCIPEVDTYLSMNPSICDTCLNNIVQIYNYKKCFLKVEAIIRRHCKVNNPIGVSNVDLCMVVKQQYALALKNKRLPPAAIKAQLDEMDLVLQNTRKIVPAYRSNVVAQNYSDTERRATASSSKTNNSVPSKYSLRHHVPSLLAASSSTRQPPIDLENPQNSFLGSLNLISSENSSTSNQASYPKTGNKTPLNRRKAKPKRKLNPAAPADDTIIILDDDSDVECNRNNVQTSKNKSAKSDDNNEVLIMNYVEENRGSAGSTATTDEATFADNSSTAVSDPATTDMLQPAVMAANPAPTIINLDGKPVSATTIKSVADNRFSAADSDTPTSTGSSIIVANTISAVTAKAVANVATGSAGSNTTPGVIILDDERSKSTLMQQTPVSSDSEIPKAVEKSVVVKLQPVDLDDLKRKVASKKGHEEENSPKRKKVLSVYLNPSLPYLHKNKKLIVKIEKKQFLTCELCDFVTNQGKDATKQHGLRKHKVCMLCDHQCSSAVLLNKHIHNHHFQEVTTIVNKSKEEDDTIIACDLCPYKAVPGFDFRDHIVNKHCGDNGSTDYKCPYKNCGLTYRQTFSLARHVEINHVLAKKLTCIICNQKCSSKKLLRIHLLSHKPSGIKCPLCGMSFRWKNLLRNHTKNKHPGIDTESSIAGMAHGSHENLIADDYGHITLDSFVNRNALSNEETGANRGTLTTDENGRIVLDLPRPNQSIADPNIVVNLEEPCSFEYPSLSEMLCESSFLQPNQEDECTVVGKASITKTQSRKRKRTIPKKNKKSKFLKVQDDMDDCMIIDKEIVTVDVSDEEALLITDSDDNDCTIVNHHFAIESQTGADEILPDATAGSTKRKAIGNSIKKSSENKDDNIVISDSESEHSDRVEDGPDTNPEEHSTTLNSESETTHQDNQNIVASIIEKTNSNKMEEAKENTVESPSTLNDKIDEHSAALELRLINSSKECTEVIICANELLKKSVSGDAEEKCEKPPRLLKEHNNPDSLEICTASDSNELLKEKDSENLEIEQSATNTAKSSFNKPIEEKVNSENPDVEKFSETMAESTDNSHEPLKEDIELELSDTSADSASVLNALLGENSSESELSESLNISDELTKENLSNNLESEEFLAKTPELCPNNLFKDEVDLRNLDPEKCTETPENSSSEILKEQVTENIKFGDSFAKNTVLSSNVLRKIDSENVGLGESELLENNINSENLETEKCSEKSKNSSYEILKEQVTENIELRDSFARNTVLSSNALLKENAENVELEESKLLANNIASRNAESAKFTNSSNKQVNYNLEFKESPVKTTELCSNDLFRDKVDSEILESQKCSENTTYSSSEILNKLTENIELLKASAEAAESSSSELLREMDIVNMELEESSKNIAESSLNKLLEEVGSKNLETEKEKILDLDADSETNLNPPSKDTIVADSVRSSYELLTETHVSNELLNGNISEVADNNLESSVATDLQTSTNELLKETISDFFDMKNFSGICLESASSSNNLLREDNEMSNNEASSETSRKDSITIDGGCATLTTDSSNEIVEDFESARVDVSCQSDSANDVIASTINSIEQLRIILEDA